MCRVRWAVQTLITMHGNNKGTTLLLAAPCTQRIHVTAKSRYRHGHAKCLDAHLGAPPVTTLSVVPAVMQIAMCVSRGYPAGQFHAHASGVHPICKIAYVNLYLILLSVLNSWQSRSRGQRRCATGGARKAVVKIRKFVCVYKNAVNNNMHRRPCVTARQGGIACFRPT